MMLKSLNGKKRKSATLPTTQLLRLLSLWRRVLPAPSLLSINLIFRSLVIFLHFPVFVILWHDGNVRSFEDSSDLSVREPTFFRNDKVRYSSENRHESKDCASEIEVLSGDGEFEGREKNGEEVGFGRLKFGISLKSYRSEKRREQSSLFQIVAITQKGIEKRPFDHFALAKSPRVKISLEKSRRKLESIACYTSSRNLDSPQERNESVSGDSRYTSARNERSERDRWR